MPSMSLEDIRFHWSLIGPALLCKKLLRKDWDGVIPRIFRPKTFNDKVLHRLIFDRRDFIPVFAGKLESRDYVLERTGDPSLLIDLIGTARNEADLRALPLPDRFIAKANHMSGRTRIFNGSEPADLAALGRAIEGWCKDQGKVEWGYRKVQRTAVIERLMQSNGDIPKDHKFFCYDGRVHFIQVDGSRFSGHTRDYFDRDWNHLELNVAHPNDKAPPARPRLLHEMIQVAECLSTGIDFVRADLYEVEDRIKFGELTCYPNGGMETFSPKKWDLEFGRPWQLPKRR